MSISRSILRILTVKALHGRTMAGELVQDSSIVPLEQALVEAPAPVILVYTDDSDFVPEHRELHGGQGSTSIVLLVAVASATVLKVEGEDATITEFAFPNTDKAIELSIDVIERQIQTELMSPDNKWGQLWLKVVTNINRVRSQRGGSTKEGTRFGARQIVMECETLWDPPVGRPVTAESAPVWNEILEALASDPDSAEGPALAERLRAIMEGRPLPSWKQTMADLGIPRETLAAIGKAPFLWHPSASDDEAAELVQISIEGLPMGTTGPGEPQHGIDLGGMTVDSDTEALPPEE